jgi:glycosyltransferase involved in cell wall biosynthesis
MKILILEPFFTGSHKKWAEEYQQFSRHEVHLLQLKGRHWKWRMYGGAVSLAHQFNQLNYEPDLILASDMLNLPAFLGLTRKTTHHIPVAIYFHENQITYPWSPDDQDVALKRDNQYGFINYTSALAADALFFNSPFHQDSFLTSLPAFLQQFPDAREKHLLPALAARSRSLPLGMHLKAFNDYSSSSNEVPVVLWNHRWEYDKNPEGFFQTLFQLKEEGYAFKLIVVGASFSHQPPIFEKAHKVLADQIIHWGYVDRKATYAQLLWKADILPVTSHQDFFGGSVVEAIYCNCYPLLPNRLAYPMHIPQEKSSLHLYDTEEELLHKMRALLGHYPDSVRLNTYQHFVAQYDWSILAPVYDEVMEQRAR